MADKDTRDDLEVHEVPAALPDGPRSEGRPAPRAPSLDEQSDPPFTNPPVTESTAPPLDPFSPANLDAPDAGERSAEDPAEAQADAEPRSFERADVDVHDAGEPTPPDRAEAPPEEPKAETEAVEPIAYGSTPAPAGHADPRPAEAFEPEIRDIPPVDGPAPIAASSAIDETPWRSAIAEVLSEPVPEAETPADSVAFTPAQDLDVPKAEALDTPEAETPAPPQVQEEEEPLPSFTAVADSLFHPPPADTDEPHLITLGRRLNPSLAIPRSVAPAVELPVERAPPIAPPSWWERTREAWRAAPWKERLRVVARYAAYAAGAYLALVLALIVLFRFVNPPGSMLMLTQLLTGTVPHRTWVPIEAMSPALIRAVVVSEDDRFCVHHGIDTAAMIQAIRQSGDGVPRGASTISMQVIKNLFLWSAKSYVRKVIEIPLTLFMELIWPKWRVLEVYLNIAEWGPGIFGAEAAAQHHFSKPASRLGTEEAALLAAALPNPIDRVAGSPGPQTTRKARVVQARVKAYGAVASCVIAAAAPEPRAPSGASTAGPNKTKTIRKSPLQPRIQRKKKNEDDWRPTLQFGY